MAEFNKEQEDFIKNKGDIEIPTAPWSGANSEESRDLTALFKVA